MSYENKIEQADKLILEYNQNVDKEDLIDKELFKKKLKKFGGVSEDALSEATYEDLENCGLPRILARKVATIFRVAPKADPSYISPKKASSMAALYLIQQYNPSEPDSIVARELINRSSGKKFIVLNSDGKVNVGKSNELLNEIQKRWSERDYVDIDGITFRVYKVGEGKSELADESPIYVGRVLRPDGTDDQLGRSWDGVSNIVRQLIYVAVTKTKEIAASNKEAHDTLDMALLTDGEKKLRQRCRKAAVLLDELIEQGNAPKLKIARTGAINGQSDPFYQNNKTY